VQPGEHGTPIAVSSKHSTPNDGHHRVEDTFGTNRRDPAVQHRRMSKKMPGAVPGRRR